MLEFRPQPGPQEALLATRADIAIFGGSAGGGKSYGLILDAARYTHVPGFTAAYFRRTFPQIAAPDGLWDLSREVFPYLGCRARDGDFEWVLPAGGRIVMRHLQHEKTKYDHQGSQYCGLYFDELTHFSASQFWYMLSRNRSTSGVRPFVRASTNPDPGSFVLDLIRWWIDESGYAIPERSGVLRWFVRPPGGNSLDWSHSPELLRRKYPTLEPLSLTFIASKLQDNPALMRADPGYLSRLQALNYVDRARLLDANWFARAVAGSLFKRQWYDVIDAIPGSPVAAVRGWDKAATPISQTNPDPDWTRGVRMVRLAPNSLYGYVITDIASVRDSPGVVDQLMRSTAQLDGKGTTQACWVDPGQAGKVDEAHVRSVLDGYTVTFERASRNKVTYAGPVSSQAEGRRIALLRGPWNQAYLDEVESFPDGPHDDIADAQSLAFLKLGNATGGRAKPAAPEGRSRWRT